MEITVKILLSADAPLLAVLSALVGKPAAINGHTNGHINSKGATSAAEKLANDAPEDAGPEITLANVREVISKKADAGKKDGIKKLLGDFGADKVTALKKEQYADFIEQANAL